MKTSAKMTAMERLREKISGEEFDYPALMDALRGYSRPRSKVTALIKAGSLVRVKKGIYVFGERYRRRPISQEVLANLLYGPSYISLEYALQSHELIPEKVQTVTSVCLGRSRRFSTPVGVYTYHGIPMKAFRLGVDRRESVGGCPFLMALPEKALADKLAEERTASFRGRKEMLTHLLENLRLDPDGLRKLDAARLDLYADRYRSNKVRLAGLCVKFLQKGKE
jgi:hypothetical protein